MSVYQRLISYEKVRALLILLAVDEKVLSRFFEWFLGGTAESIYKVDWLDQPAIKN